MTVGVPVVLITGALTGIGRATALAFAKEGATVVVSGRREAEGKALEAELRGLGAQAAFVRADVRHEGDVSNLVDQTVARFGRLDVAVNNAGTEGKPGPVIEQTLDSYTAMFETNVLGTLLSLKHELRVMQPQGSGSIINISSTMGERGAANLSLYTASKHAVEGLTKSAALEGAPFGGACQCRRAWSDGDRYARSSDWHARQESSLLCRRTAQTRCKAGRDRRRHRVPRFRQSVLHHRTNHQDQRRQNRQLKAIPVHA
jgi:NAD(P)-dependent dehydrogenase (short-subunit alcohol dehydrogenase family)